jgi:hypothetical protein
MWNKSRSNEPPPPGVNPAYSSFGYKSGPFNPPSQPSQSVPDYRHKPGVPGGGWDEDEPHERIRKPGSFEVSRTTPAYAPSMQPVRQPEPVQSSPAVPTSYQAQHPKPAPPVKLHSTLAVSAEPGLYERRLIEDITQQGGARPKPPDKDLNELASKCMYLQCEVVGYILLETLNNPNRSLKALYVLEKLAHTYDSYQELLRENISALQSAMHSPAHTRVVSDLINFLGVSPQSTRTDLLEDIISL